MYLRTRPVALLLPMLLVGACAGSGSAPGPAAVPMPTAPASSEQTDSTKPIFLVHASGSNPHDALVDGQLIYRDNCFYIGPPHRARQRGGRGTLLPIWPEGFTYRGKGRETSVIGPRGRVVVRVGQELVGGGEVTRSKEYASSMLKNPGQLSDCEGPYWLMSRGIDQR